MVRFAAHLLIITGLEKGEEQAMSIKQQVQYLIEEATDPINLAQGESAHMYRS